MHHRVFKFWRKSREEDLPALLEFLQPLLLLMHELKMDQHVPWLKCRSKSAELRRSPLPEAHQIVGSCIEPGQYEDRYYMQSVMRGFACPLLTDRERYRRVAMTMV